MVNYEKTTTYSSSVKMDDHVTSLQGSLDYFEGVLSPELRGTIDAHVAGCPRCLAFVASYTATPRILREATATAIPARVQESLRAFLRTKSFDSPE